MSTPLNERPAFFHQREREREKESLIHTAKGAKAITSEVKEMC